jgi:sulfur transfer complex TusBCD TusB component (DsrH family)
MIGQGHTTPATSQENEQAQKMMSNIEEFVLDQEVQDALIQKMSQGEPADAIGNIAGQLIHMQVVVARGAGEDISRDILLAVAAEVINLLVEVGMQAGLVQIQDEKQLEKLQGDALISAVDAYMNLGDDQIDGEAAAAFAEESMGGAMDSPEAQQGMINNMASTEGPPPEGPPPEGPPPEGQPQQGGLIGGMV